MICAPGGDTRESNRRQGASSRAISPKAAPAGSGRSGALERPSTGSVAPPLAVRYLHGNDPPTQRGSRCLGRLTMRTRNVPARSCSARPDRPPHARRRPRPPLAPTRRSSTRLSLGCAPGVIEYPPPLKPWLRKLLRALVGLPLACVLLAVCTSSAALAERSRQPIAASSSLRARSSASTPSRRHSRHHRHRTTPTLTRNCNTQLPCIVAEHPQPITAG